MINDDKLSKLYEETVEGKELTTGKLNDWGFNSKDISELIDKGILERIKRGYYKFLSIDKLYQYGIKLISMKQFDKANMCFEKCYELDPSHSGVAFQLFIRKVQNEEYQKSFEYFDKIYNKNNSKFCKNDTNFYLYMLNVITDMPKKYKNIARKIKYNDVEIGLRGKKTSEEEYIDNIRSLAINKKFVAALKKENILVKQNEKLTAQDIITKMLLSRAIKTQMKIKDEILVFINDKKYNELSKYLENMQDKYQLSYADSSVLQITRDLKKIINYNIIPKKKNCSTNKLFEAIMNRDYELALSLSSNYSKENNMESKDNAIYLLLVEINKYIHKENNLKNEEEKDLINNKNVNIEDKKSDSTISFSQITQSLLNKDLDKTFVILRQYLEKNNKSEYEFLIVNLIKLSILEKDIAFSKPMLTLSNILIKNYVFVISEYIQNFYECLSQNKFDHARIYLDILSKSNKLGQQCILTDNLGKLLNSIEINYISKNKEAETEKESNEPEKESNEPEKVLIETIQPIKENNNLEQENNSYNKNYIEEKLDKLREKGILLLKPMNSEKINKIKNIVDETPDVVSFDIEYEGLKQLALRYKPLITEKINIVEVAREGNKAYKNGDYNLCINIYRQLLEIGEPKSWVYSRLGLAYMKKWNIKQAIDYLKVATSLGNQEEAEYDFSELIDSLKGIDVSENKKVKVKMEETDFYNDLNEYYGIDCIDEISNLIESGSSLKDACNDLKLNEEQKQLILLIYVKECYATENYYLGDIYLSKVEKSKNKSKNINCLISEIRTNKKFYKNRMNEENKKLILIPSNKGTK